MAGGRGKNRVLEDQMPPVDRRLRPELHQGNGPKNRWQTETTKRVTKSQNNQLFIIFFFIRKLANFQNCVFIP